MHYYYPGYFGHSEEFLEFDSQFRRRKMNCAVDRRILYHACIQILQSNPLTDLCIPTFIHCFKWNIIYIYIYIYVVIFS